MGQDALSAKFTPMLKLCSVTGDVEARSCQCKLVIARQGRTCGRVIGWYDWLPKTRPKIRVECEIATCARLLLPTCANTVQADYAGTD